MLARSIALFLSIAILTVALNSSVSAQSSVASTTTSFGISTGNETQKSTVQNPQPPVEMGRSSILTNRVADFKADSGTMSSRENNELKTLGKKYSTQRKVWIGLGIAAAAIGIFVFAASRDKIKYGPF